MKLGGFVIHGNSRKTLDSCLTSLCAVCDEVVAVDSDSTDGSRDLVQQRGLRSLNVSWQGYGAARAAAVGLLAGHFEYVMFLDADEWLDEPAVRAIRKWKAQSPSLPVYRMKRRNWANVNDQRFVYRVDRRARLIRQDIARWSPEMIVHEALPRLRAGRVDGFIEHDFATPNVSRVQKDEQYALLWAVQAHAKSRRAKPLLLQHAAHFLKDGVLGGAFFRGGAGAVGLVRDIARYHARKHAFLARMNRGEFAMLAEMYRAREFKAIFPAAAKVLAEESRRVLRGGEVASGPDSRDSR